MCFNLPVAFFPLYLFLLLIQDEQIREEEDKPGMWEETFKSHSDSKPNGTLKSS